MSRSKNVATRAGYLLVNTASFTLPLCWDEPTDLSYCRAQSGPAVRRRATFRSSELVRWSVHHVSRWSRIHNSSDSSVNTRWYKPPRLIAPP